jgi:hypothetical protein
MEERPTTWRVAANIFNKQSRIADRGWSSSLGVGRGGKNSSPKKNNITYNEMDRSRGKYGVKERWIQPFYGELRIKRTLRRPKRRLNDNIKMDTQEIVLEGRGVD